MGFSVIMTLLRRGMPVGHAGYPKELFEQIDALLRLADMASPAVALELRFEAQRLGSKAQDAGPTAAKEKMAPSIAKRKRRNKFGMKGALSPEGL